MGNCRQSGCGSQERVMPYYEQHKKSCESSCGSGVMKDDMMGNYSLAMAYVPWQRWKNLYEPHEALKVGTIFCDLNKPFLGKKGACL